MNIAKKDIQHLYKVQDLLLQIELEMEQLDPTVKDFVANYTAKTGKLYMAIESGKEAIEEVIDGIKAGAEEVSLQFQSLLNGKDREMFEEDSDEDWVAFLEEQKNQLSAIDETVYEQFQKWKYLGITFSPRVFDNELETYRVEVTLFFKDNRITGFLETYEWAINEKKIEVFLSISDNQKLSLLQILNQFIYEQLDAIIFRT